MADIDAPFVQEILDIPERKREPDVEHHRQADHFGTGFEIAERAAYCHSATLLSCPARFNQVSSDKTVHSTALPSML
jgi:hypothetical protein